MVAEVRTMAAKGKMDQVIGRRLLLGGVLAAVCLFAGVVSADAPKLPNERPTVVSRAEAIEDVDFLVRQLREKHPNPFARISQADFEREVVRLKEGLPEQVNIREFSLSVAALLALVGDTHTRHRDETAYYEHLRKGGRVFPVKLRYQDGQMTIETWSPQVIPDRLGVGDAVLAVNGVCMESLVERYGRYVSVETDLQRRCAMEWWFDKYQVLLGEARDPYRLQLRDAQGQVYEETLPAAPPWLEQYEASKAQGPPLHCDFYHEGRTCLFRIRNFDRGARQEYDKAVWGLLEAMRERRTEYLILDLRGNGGGDGGLGMQLLRLVIDKPYAEDLKPASEGGWPVKLALLCDRSTYSAASWLAMVVQDCHVGIIAGEETGGRASFSGEIVSVSLPHSGLSCGIGTKFFMRRAGYDDGRGVLPDLPLDVTLDDRRLVEEIHTFMGQKESEGGR